MWKELRKSIRFLGRRDIYLIIILSLFIYLLIFAFIISYVYVCLLLLLLFVIIIRPIIVIVIIITIIIMDGIIITCTARPQAHIKSQPVIGYYLSLV